MSILQFLKKLLFKPEPRIRLAVDNRKAVKRQRKRTLSGEMPLFVRPWDAAANDFRSIDSDGSWKPYVIRKRQRRSTVT